MARRHRPIDHNQGSGVCETLWQLDEAMSLDFGEPVLNEVVTAFLHVCSVIW